jgi:hypothetical protein
MGLASLGLENGIFGGFLYGVLLSLAILGLDFSGLALSRPQAHLRRVVGLPVQLEHVGEGAARRVPDHLADLRAGRAAPPLQRSRHP